MGSDTGHDLPAGIGNPARRALATIGVTRLEQIAATSEHELLAPHGFGPKAPRIPREAIEAPGWTFGETSGADETERSKRLD